MTKQPDGKNTNGDSGRWIQSICDRCASKQQLCDTGTPCCPCLSAAAECKYSAHVSVLNCGVRGSVPPYFRQSDMSMETSTAPIDGTYYTSSLTETGFPSQDQGIVEAGGYTQVPICILRTYVVITNDHEQHIPSSQSQTVPPVHQPSATPTPWRAEQQVEPSTTINTTYGHVQTPVVAPHAAVPFNPAAIQPTWTSASSSSMSLPQYAVPQFLSQGPAANPVHGNDVDPHASGYQVLGEQTSSTQSVPYTAPTDGPVGHTHTANTFEHEYALKHSYNWDNVQSVNTA
ncbi:hypothetical protein C8Q76DRAFT_802257 [Earliella scabrosa]|nr:hypothetical protein C8Q76DRAFT_802257 [Earliella scabrosa]